MIRRDNGSIIADVRILYCRPEPVANVINTRTLGGSWFTQTVGRAARRAQVQVIAVGAVALTALQDAYATGQQITVEYDGFGRTGFIDGLPSYNLYHRGAPSLRRYQVNFILNITAEAPL